MLQILAAGLLLILCSEVGVAQLNQDCTVSVLNRTVRVNPDGSWVLPNVPANFGQVKARATCVRNGVTTSGESDYFTIPANGAVNLPEIVMGSATQIPASLGITPANPSLTGAGQTVQLVVTATYPDNSTRDVSAASTGINYTTSNPAIATVNADGLVTAVASGTVVLQASNDGATGIIRATVLLSDVDSDGDGIPDDIEISLGLDAHNPVDAQEDFERDGLTNLREFQLGTGLRVFDTDGDSIGDGLEVQTGSNPLDPNSFNMAQALRSIRVSPTQVNLIVNTIIGVASQQLTVTGTLTDGNTINLTSRSRGTNYNSSNLNVANFGAVDGLVFAGNDGTATITVSNSGFTATVQVTVSSFSPTALSFVSIPGFANNVDISGNVAYVAAGSTGLQVVDVSDRRAPRIIGSLDTPGNANDVRVVGNRAYIADGSAGLRIIDVTNPASPTLLGALDTPGEANDVVVVGNLAYVADGPAGLQIIDVSDPVAPRLVGTLDTPGTARGVDVSGNLAVVADGSSLRIIDVGNPSSPVARGSLATTDARDLTVEGTIAYLADFSGSLKTIDLSTPAAPRLLATTTQALGGILTDAAKVREFVFGADVFFVNGVPIVNVGDPVNPSVRARLDFPARDDNGTGIAVDNQFVYLTADRSIQENGVNGDSRLYIGQYVALEDKAGIPPVVTITSPAAGATAIGGSVIPITVQATDDVQVAAVDFLVNGNVVFTDSVTPYQFNLTIPTGVTTITLGATATDIGGNVGTAPSVQINVIPDPLTTVTGRVVNTDGVPQSGAVVTCLAASTTSAGDGRFMISGLPTISGSISCAAVLTLPDSSVLRGTSQSVVPVPAGTTEVGDIVVGRLTYLGFNPQDNARLLLTGWSNGTSFKLSALEDGRTLRDGTIDRFGVLTIPLSGVRHFKLEASSPLLATFGFDCCNFGGSFFYTAVDGTRLVGRSFIFRIPVLSANNEFIVFAHEASDITVRNTAGQVVLATSLPAGRFFSTTGSPLAAGAVYQLEATGDVALMSNSRNAYTAVPSRNGEDVGTEFLCGTLNWETSAIAIFAYENATVTATRIQTGAQAFTRILQRGEFAYVSGFGDEKFKITSTGRIAVWAGSTEGGNSIAFMGDDATINTGDRGREFFVHTQSQGAFVLVLENQTTIEIDGVVQVLNAGQFIDLPPGGFRHIVANKPVIVETIGGNGLNDWETALRLIR
jgi:hypothetical protein